MASSSVHFKKATSHSSAHNTRADIPKYLLPEEHRLKNEYWQNEKSARQIFDDELINTTRKGGPKPKFENSHWEAVLNLNAGHSLADVQKVAKLIEKKFNITCTSIAVHRDEGHIKEGQPIYNYHAHLEFVTYQNGQQNWRREHVKNGLSELQTIVANELKMTRGRDKRESGTERLEHREFKAVAKEKERLVLEKEKEQQYNFREYQAKITALETENIDLKKELHKLNTQVNKGQADVQILEKRLENYKTLYTSANERADRAEAKEVIVEKIVKVEDTTKIKELEKTISELRQEKISSFQNEALKALEAKKAPETIKDIPKEPIVQKTAPRSLIVELRERVDKHYEQRPQPIYSPDNLIDKSWTFKDCMHWLWAQGEAKQAREERFEKEREKILEPYKTWEATNKKLEKAWQKAIADEDKKREEPKQEPKVKQEALVLTQTQIAEIEVAKFNQEHEDEDYYQGRSQ